MQLCNIMFSLQARLTEVFLVGALGVEDQQNGIPAAPIEHHIGSKTKFTNQNPEHLIN